jgi:hypothetical protein
MADNAAPAGPSSEHDSIVDTLHDGQPGDDDPQAHPDSEEVSSLREFPLIEAPSQSEDEDEEEVSSLRVTEAHPTQ